MRLKRTTSEDGKLFGAALNDIRHVLHLPYKEMARQTGIDASRIHNICNRGTHATREELDRTIAILVDKQANEPLRAYLKCKYPVIFGDESSEETPLYPADVALKQWIEARDQRATPFYDKCVKGSKGRFLLMRRDQEGKMICALMRVRPPAHEHALPTFNTIRYMPNGLKRTTQGFIFELHGRVYSLGQLDNLRGLRFSNLHVYDYGSRSDLFGIRVGILSGTMVTFASRIYAYQIQASARPVGSQTGILKRLLKPWHPDENGDLVAKISGFRTIYTMLAQRDLVDNGIIATPS